MNYNVRAIDGLLKEMLTGLPAIALDGPKGVGKTATAMRQAQVTYNLEDPQGLALYLSNPTLTPSEGTIFIDEWQHFPDSWNQVRRAVDDGAKPGSFLLAGSATPADSAGTHSGAGRIVSLRMYPMGFSERAVVTPTVSLAGLLSGDEGMPVAGETDFAAADYAEEIAASGFPGIRGYQARYRQAQIDSYLERIIDRDLPDAGFASRDRDTLRRWMTAYASGVSTTLSQTKLIKAVYAASEKVPATSTIANYQRHLERIWIVDPLPAWLPAFNPLRELGTSPKHQLADPGLAVALLNLNAGSLLREQNITYFGQLFESLTALTLRSLLDPYEYKLKHMRTHRGEHEVDLIVERRDGAVLAVEVKTSATPIPADQKHLDWLKATWKGELLGRVIINTGRHAYRQPDGTAVVPLALLGS